VDSLAESQLFGHVKGAFTDAREDSLGYFRSASGGTLFLDEIGELPLKLQPKLLRAVENREVQPVGSARDYQIDIQLVCASNRDLRAMMKAGTFREDLYYRLNSATITLPPLRERGQAIPRLIAHFAAHYGTMFNKNIRFISRTALDELCAYPWPGNIRELAHVIESAVMMTDRDRISLDDLPAHILPRHVGAAAAQIPFDDSESNAVVAALPRSNPSEKSSMQLDGVIKETVLRSIQHTGGNRRRAADLLGVSRSTLYRMLARYGLDGSAKRELGSNPDSFAYDGGATEQAVEATTYRS
jgi:DNA-binding NtrC family response regulator